MAPQTPPGLTRCLPMRNPPGAHAMPPNALLPRGLTRCPPMRSLSSSAGQQLLRASEVGRLHHLALEGERVDAALRVILEQRDQLASFVDGLFGRCEDLVDHGDLSGMDGDLAGEAHGHSVLALAPEAVEIGDVREDGV